MTVLWAARRRRLIVPMAIFTVVSIIFYLQNRRAKVLFPSSAEPLKEPLQTTTSSVSDDPDPLVLADIGFILRTGWEVRDRLDGPIDTWLKQLDKEQLVIYCDLDAKLKNYTLQDFYRQLPMYKAKKYKDLPQFQYYRKLHDRRKPLPSSPGLEPSTRNEGWKLDATKQVASVYLGYKELSKRRPFKFYVLVDDDTYIHTASLLAVLSRVKSDEPRFIGQYWREQGGFMLGGSGLVFTHAALSLLIDQRHDLAKKMLAKIPFQSLGDLHLAEYMRKAGVTIDETYSAAFYHERLELRFTNKDRWCAPIASVHHQSPVHMLWTHKSLGTASKSGPVYMRQFLNALTPETMRALRRGENRSFVECVENENHNQVCQYLTMDNATQAQNADSCQLICKTGEAFPGCAAWVYRPSDRLCVLGNGFVTNFATPRPGDLVGWSGINMDLLDEWQQQCTSSIWQSVHPT